MTDKTAIEKARDALVARDDYIKLLCEELNELYGSALAHGFISTRVEAGDLARQKILLSDEALAAIEAEKQAESAEVCLSKMFRDIRKIGYITDPLRLTNESHDACVDLLNHFAESYHAEQCKQESAAILSASDRLGVALGEAESAKHE